MRCAVAVLLLVGSASAFYLPGVAPKSFKDGDKVEMKVNRLTSASALSYDFYHLPFCRPPGGIVDAAENLGEHLSGDTIQNSAYELAMNVNKTCQVLCNYTLTAEVASRFQKFVRAEYYQNWILDNLPAADVDDRTEELDPTVLHHKVEYSSGIPVGGRQVDTNLYLFNHMRMTIKYHVSSEYEGKRIVGFDVHPLSVAHTYDPETLNITSCPNGALPQHPTTGRFLLTGSNSTTTRLYWTYDTLWVPSNIKWASRWDIYLSMGDRYPAKIHWFSILNSFLIVLFLSALVALIMVRALKRDFSRYNRVATDEEKAEDREETGWKMVHADVFRPPKNPMLFSVVVGVGSQVMGMAVVTILFAAAGFLSPANRGSLMTSMLLVFLFMGAGAGYVAARTHKMLNGVSYQRCTILVAVGLPAILFTVVFILNLFVWAKGSSDAIPFTSMFLVITLWMVCSVPLVFVGAYNGFKKDKIEHPVRTGSIPRPVPPQGLFYTTPLVMAAGGILPFGAIFVELFFILTSLWQNQYYYVFGFLFIVFILLAVTCAEISIVLVYFQLCAEDHRWWWRSVVAPGAAGLYLFLYSIYYYATRLHMADGTSTLLYFGYMAIISFLFSLITGTIGHLATFSFVTRIYGSIKVD